eukprot:symbB.v1.2.002541.t4/scaffold103.1/size331058/6
MFPRRAALARREAAEQEDVHSNIAPSFFSKSPTAETAEPFPKVHRLESLLPLSAQLAKRQAGCLQKEEFVETSETPAAPSTRGYPVEEVEHEPAQLEEKKEPEETKEPSETPAAPSTRGSAVEEVEHKPAQLEEKKKPEETCIALKEIEESSGRNVATEAPMSKAAKRAARRPKAVASRRRIRMNQPVKWNVTRVLITSQATRLLVINFFKGPSEGKKGLAQLLLRWMKEGDDDIEDTRLLVLPPKTTVLEVPESNSVPAIKEKDMDIQGGYSAPQAQTKEALSMDQRVDRLLGRCEKENLEVSASEAMEVLQQEEGHVGKSMIRLRREKNGENRRFPFRVPVNSRQNLGSATMTIVLRSKLTDVKLVQPSLPELPEEALVQNALPKATNNGGNILEKSETGSLPLGAMSRGSTPNPIELSQQFQRLLKALAQQHVNELADMRHHNDGDPAGSGIDSGTLRSFDLHRSGQHGGRRSQQQEQSFGGGTEDELGDLPFKRVVSPASVTSLASSRVMPSPKFMDAAMMNHKSSLRSVDVQRVLESMEELDKTSDVNSSSSQDQANSSRWQRFFQSRFFEASIMSILFANVFWMALHLQVYGTSINGEPGAIWNTAFLIGDLFFDIVFVAEVTFRVCVFGRSFFRAWINLIDLLVGIACVAEILLLTTDVGDFGFDISVLRLLRVIKVLKSLRMLNVSNTLAPLHLLIKCLEACVGMLFWSFFLMSFVQCMAGIIVSELCSGFILDPANDPAARAEVYEYYGTFTRTILSMFEVMFANWGPACRVLVQNVSEWFSLFFLFYRCVMGFAVLNVVGAVFVQQALRTASSDDELAFRQKERDIQAYNRKVKKLFQSIDGSGDGITSVWTNSPSWFSLQNSSFG